MTIQQIKELAERKPFKPFVITLDSGRKIEVNRDTEFLFPKNRPDTIYVFASDGQGWIFEAEAVSALNDYGGGA